MFKDNISAIYDSKGNLYEIPNYCINEPYKFMESSFDEKSVEEKSIIVIIRHGVDDYKINIPNTIKVFNLKQALIKKIKNKGSIKSIRLFYLGKELRDNKKMTKVKNNCIIQALLIFHSFEEKEKDEENQKEKKDENLENIKVTEKFKEKEQITNVNKSNKLIPKYKPVKNNTFKCNLNEKFKNCDSKEPTDKNQDIDVCETFKEELKKSNQEEFNKDTTSLLMSKNIGENEKRNDYIDKFEIDNQNENIDFIKKLSSNQDQTHKDEDKDQDLDEDLDSENSKIIKKKLSDINETLQNYQV